MQLTNYDMSCLEEVLEKILIDFPGEFPRSEWIKETYEYLFDMRTKGVYK